jgi:HlyD family secretion protein
VRHKKLIITVVALALVIAIIAAFRSNGRQQPQYFTAKVERGNIRAQVEATGTINAVTTVQVGSQVSGTIAKLNADFNSRVKRGQVIARIDPSLFEGNLLQAKADLENARANLAAAKANLEKARAAAVQMRADYQRAQGLTRDGVLSQQQLDFAKANTDSAAAAVSAAHAQVSQADAQVKQRSAQVQVAQTNLNHTVIAAPIDGTVIARSVDVGQTVAASLQAPTLFTIAQDLTKMLVYTKTDESDVGRIRPGQPVSFKVDAFPNETFRGRVKEVRMNATVVQNVVTYDTVIEFDNPDLKLFPGMTAYVTIPVARAESVLKIPNSALRYKPDMSAEEIRALYQKYGIQMPRGEQTESAGGSSPTGLSPTESKGGGEAPAGTARVGTGILARASEPQGSPSGERRRERPQNLAVVWKLLPDKSLQPVRVRTGITDYTFTEVAEGELKEGDQVVTGSQTTRSSGNPLGMRPGGGGRRP